MIRCDNSCVAIGPPTRTLPVYSVISPPFRYGGQRARAPESFTGGTPAGPAEQVAAGAADHDRALWVLAGRSVVDPYGDPVPVADRVRDQGQPQLARDVAEPVVEPEVGVVH